MRGTVQIFVRHESCEKSGRGGKGEKNQIILWLYKGLIGTSYVYLVCGAVVSSLSPSLSLSVSLSIVESSIGYSMNKPRFGLD